MKIKGLKIHRALLSQAEVAALAAQPEYAPQDEARVALFRLFGEFGHEGGSPPPSAWMLAWGDRLVELGLFSERPNQYRVCDWVGDLKAQFKYHIDNERFGPEILAICVTGPRRIGFRDPSRPDVTQSFDFEPGDAYMMSRAARWSWEHCVLPVGASGSGGKSFIISHRRQ